MKQCCVCRAEQNAHLSFHRFPSNPDRQRKWLKILNLRNSRKLFVCSMHFKSEDYRKSCRKPLLKTNAIPSLNIPGLDTNGNNKQTIRKFDKGIQCSMKEYKNVSREFATSAGSVQNLERTSNSCNKSIVPPSKWWCLEGFRTFKRQDFKCKIRWDRFLTGFEELKNDKELLKLENKHLRNKVQMLKNIIESGRKRI